VCEGTKTEPTYFERAKVHYRIPSMQIKIFGEGKQYDTLVYEAVAIAKDEGLFLKKEETKDQLWCVFDNDSDGNEMKINFKQIFETAEKQCVRIAYSDSSFEFWLLLHFDYVTSHISNDDLKDKLTKKIQEDIKKQNFKYRKNLKNIPEGVFEKRYDNAINNADRLLKCYEVIPSKFRGISYPKKFEDCRPFTSVHFLMMKLKNFNTSR